MALGKRLLRVLCASAVCSCFFSCADGTRFAGLAPTPAGTGPTVVFDPARTPLPEIPFPNDIATRPDPTSPTGLRINGSIIAPTRLESGVRGLLDELDGFGTFAPISVAFDAPIDALDLFARQNDGDPSNDAVFLIDLESGALPPLDVGGGRFPLELPRGDQYFLADPLRNVMNLLLPADNVFHPGDPLWRSTPARAADDLLTFYERETGTLILRPALPLLQRHRYAVVLTRRLRGTDGQPVRSPFAGINHAAQTERLRGLPALLPPGTALDDVAFAWSFTTQTTTRDLEVIRQGLYGSGPLGFLWLQYPVQNGETCLGSSAAAMSCLTLRQLVDDPQGGASPYLLPSAKIAEVVADPQVSGLLIGTDPEAIAALVDSLKYVDYFVAGEFDSPSFLADRDRGAADTSFRLDLRGGWARTRRETIPFFAAVPKKLAGREPPFPTVIVGHGYKSNRFEGIVGFAGTFAKHGLATVTIDAYGHGIGIDAVLEALGRVILQRHGLVKLGDAIFKSRARDLDNDNVLDPGGDFWTADAFHTRDVVRQSIVDWMQLIRLLRTFDGKSLMRASTSTALAGDFDGDDKVDLGGPDGDYYIFGQSLGGILSAVLPAVEPRIVAAAPGSSAGGLTDVVVRSTEQNVVKAALLEVLGPLIATCGYERARRGCGAGPPTLVFDVQNVNNEAILPIALLTLSPGDRVTVRNLAQTTASAPCEKGCTVALADDQGRLRAGIAADSPTLSVSRDAQGVVSSVSVLRPGDPLSITVEPAAGGAARVIDKWEIGTTFQGVEYPAGAPLVAPARGYGYRRNTPDLRRLFALSQTILGAGDPISYAPHYFKDPLPARRGVPANVLVLATVGDTTVPVATAIALARAAGLVEMDRPDPDFGVPIDQVLIRGAMVEGLARTRRFEDPGYGPRALLGGHVRCDAGSRCGDQILLDPEGFSCDANGANCTDGYGGPRLDPPLREKTAVRTGAGVSALVFEYLDPRGEHSFKNPHPNNPFDYDMFFANMVGRYFQTRGTEISFDKCQAKIADCPWTPPVP